MVCRGRGCPTCVGGGSVVSGGDDDDEGGEQEDSAAEGDGDQVAQSLVIRGDRAAPCQRVMTAVSTGVTVQEVVCQI